jgi:hypothetical protein
MAKTLLDTLTSAITKSQLLFVTVLLVLANVGNGHAQVTSYVLQQEQLASFVNLPSTTRLYPGTNALHDGITALPLNFPFYFNGNSYNTVYISVHGFVTFGNAPSQTEAFPLSSSAAYSGAISVYGADLGVLNTSTAFNVFAEASGTAPSRVQKIQWRLRRGSPTTYGTYGTAASQSHIAFQLWLHEDNRIEMYYDVFSTFNNNTADFFGQIGLRGSTPTDFINLSYEPASGHWPGVAPAPVGTMPLGTVNTSKVKTDNLSQILPTSNRKFTWTPITCFAPTGLTAVPDITTATLSWSAAAPAPGNGYEYYYSTSATAPTSATAASGSVAAGVTTASLSALSPSTTYYVYVRSICSATDKSGWSAATIFTTRCTARNLPYLQYFDPYETGYEYTVPAIPPCSSTENLGPGNNWVTKNFSAADEFYDEHIVYHANGTSDAANTWFYTQGINLVAGNTYRISYMYGGSTEYAFLTNKMEVKFGTAPDDAAMTNLIADHNNIKASPLYNVVNFTAPSTGVFYFGFHAYSAGNMGDLMVDNIEILPAVCFQPNGLSSANVTATTALLTWNVPSPAPASGYAYYVTTTNVAPVNGTSPSGYTSSGTNVVNLSGLNPSTTYYVWVRGNCGGGDFSQWSTGISFLTGAQPVYAYCTPAPTSVDNQGIINITMGSINNSSGDEPGHYANYSSLSTNVSQGATVPVAITYGTGFTYYTKIWVDWNNDSDFWDAGENVYTGESTSANPTTLNANFVVPAGASLGQHRIRIGGSDTNTLVGINPGEGPCYNGVWGTFEDYTINVVAPPPALAINITSSSQCAGTPSPTVSITTPLTNYTTYSWSPAIGVSGNPVSGYTFTSSTTITYTLTGVQTAFPFSTNTVNFTYNASPLPTPIVITPTAPTVCQSGPAVALTATGGIVSGITVLSENFNGTASTWTKYNTSVGGNTAAAAWTLRPSGYNPGGSTGIASLVSNDATQFYLTNSDAQGSGSTTNVILESPTFSLTGYTNASMSFFHYYKPWINGSAKVEIFNGTSWVAAPLMSWGNSSTPPVTPPQGTPTNFTQVNINLNAYAGMANLKIRFNYTAQWGYVWAIDNFLVSGSASSSITWTPIAGLYSNAAATIPYVAGTGTNTVYALPTATQTYTASASTPAPASCSTTSNVTVTVTTVTAGTVSPVSQTVCDVAAPLLLSGQVGSVVEWQYSTTAAFTTPVAIPSSTSTTLTSAQIGSFSGIRYYRAVVGNGGCTGYSTVVSITFNVTTWTGTWSNGLPDATKRVVFNTNYTSSANMSACSILVTAGNVVFNANHTLTATNEVTVTGGSLTFNHNSALVQVNDAAVNSGNILYKRNSTLMTTYDYTYWSSPVASQNLLAVSPATMLDKFWIYNTPTASFVNVVPSLTTMLAAKGYLIRAPQGHTPFTPYVASFNGVPHNGIKNIPIVVSGANVMNLIGNPYPSAVNADLFLTHPTNSNIMQSTLYFWTHHTPIANQVYTASDYAVYNLVGGVGTGTPAGGTAVSPNGKIAAGQGFIAFGKNAGGTAVFNNSMRVVGNNTQFFRSADTDDVTTTTSLEKHRIWLQMSNIDGAYKQMLTGYVETATNAWDDQFEGRVLEAGNAISFYSVLDNQHLAIQGRSLPFEFSDLVPLGYKATNAGNLEISLADFDGLFDDVNVGIYLEDQLLNVIHDLRAGGYSFATTAGQFNDRFVMRYTNSALNINQNIFNDNSVVVIRNTAGIHINSGSASMATVTIFDIQGRQISQQKNINSNEAHFTTLPDTRQVLLVKVTSGSGASVTKKIVY